MANDMTNISGVSDITDLATNNEIPFLRDSKTPEEIFNSVCDDLRKVCGQVKSIIKKNAPVNETGGVNVEKTVIMPELSSTLRQKANIVNKLTNNIKDSNEQDFPQFKNEAILSLPVMMVEENNSCAKALGTLDRLKKRNDDYLQLLTEAENFLADMEEAEISLGKADAALNRTHKRARDELVVVKEDLTHVIEALFEDEETSQNMYALLEELVKKSQSTCEEDEWYEATDVEMMPLIMMLCQAGVIFVNPHNDKQVKLVI